MEPIPEKVVNSIHREFSGIQTEDLREKAEDLHAEQPELMAFVQACINQMEGDGADLAVYLFFMICRMYSETYGDEIASVSPEDIMGRYKKNEEQIEKLTDAQDTLDEDSFGLNTGQPHLIDYLMEVLKRARDEEKEALTVGEQTYIFLILSTVMMVLNDAVDRV